MSPELRALMWTFDRLMVDNLTDKERRKTAREIGKVILGQPSRASTYEPNGWDDSVKLLKPV